ncbi:MAG: isopeptide-forming domain-containing fimbrial protein [Oscillospiraceae bacterium]|nr:isopeptide-forming domain-containing fimbrial protein [Oscillospiraceae bacterium]
MKRFLSILLTLTMILGLGVSAMAVALPEGTKGADKTITIKSPANIAADAVSNYTVYKVFDATVGADGKISYKLMSGVNTVPDGFIADVNGTVYLGTTSATATNATGEIYIKIANTGATTDYVYLTPQTTDLTEAQITAIKNYAAKVEVGTASITGPDTEKTVIVPAYGYYYITTTNGSAVTIDSTTPYANVVDKNPITPPDKEIFAVKNPDGTVSGAGSLDATGQHALAQLGSVVEYSATVTKQNGAKNYIFHDTMGAGLTYNNDVKVYNSTSVFDNTTEVAESAATFSKTTATGDTITISFVDSYIQGLANGTVLTIKYSATVNSDALTVDSGKNTASLSYGDNNQVIPSPDTPVVYNAKLTVTKVDGNNAALAGAGFILAKDVAAVGTAGEAGYVEAHREYYKYTAASGTTPAKVEWVTDITQATEKTTSVTDGVAQVEFTGLADGTYILIENTVPQGYNPAPEETFTIAQANANITPRGEDVQKTIVNNSGAELPSTGGIGTTIFYIIGGLLAVGAGVVLVTKKRMGKEEN